MRHFSDALLEGYSLIESSIDPKYLTMIKATAGPNAIIIAKYGKDGDTEAAATILRKDEKLFQAMLNRFNSFSHNGVKMKATDVTDENTDMIDEGDHLAYVEVLLDNN